MTTEADLFRSYSPTAVGDHVLRVMVEERIAELWRYRRWYRTHRWADWSELRREHDIELRALVRLVRRARALAAPDPLTLSKGYDDWTSGELAEAFGR